MKRRTNVSIEAELLKEAQQDLGINGVSATLNRVLEIFVRQERIKSLTSRDLFCNIAPEDFEKMQSDRIFGDGE